MISPTICPYPFAHQHIDPNGDIKYCCNGSPDSHINQDTGQHYNVKTDDLASAWNSEAIKQLRLDLIAGREPTACRGCWERESADHKTGSSMRLAAAMQHIPISTVKSQIEYAEKHHGQVDTPPKDFQIMTGNMCNLACKMCGPRYSNTWSKWHRNKGFTELKDVSLKLGGGGFSNPEDSVIYLGRDQDWPITHPLKNVFSGQTSNIRHIFLTGGEPTLIPEIVEFLEHLVVTGDSKNIMLRFSTNLTNINQRLLTALSQFGRIGINLSVDGMDDIAYIQRTPSRWPQILKNVDYLIDWMRAHQKQNRVVPLISFNTVVTALNIHHVPDLWKFLSDRYGTEFHLGFTTLMDSNDNYTIRQVPQSVIPSIRQRVSDIRKDVAPNIRAKLDDFEYYLKQDIYSEDHVAIQHLLNGIQSLHPELNIKEIYRIYYPDAV
jgi:MoaA/NifB/PqqE/SkfB family radical SAM enzyme